MHLWPGDEAWELVRLQESQCCKTADLDWGPSLTLPLTPTPSSSSSSGSNPKPNPYQHFYKNSSAVLDQFFGIKTSDIIGCC